MNKYQHRKEAGRVLAGELRSYANRDDILVLALPRGGVPVAYEIAIALHLPLDVFIVRKLGVPSQPELAMGAIGSGDTVVFNNQVIDDWQVSQSDIERVIAIEKKELSRREKAYRDNRPPLNVKGKTIILVDDGVATGATMRAAIKALNEMKADNIIVAVPVAEKYLCEGMALMVDDFICPLRPEQLHAVGAWFEDFPQTDDAEVKALLNQANKERT